MILKNQNFVKTKRIVVYGKKCRYIKLIDNNTYFNNLKTIFMHYYNFLFL